MGVAADHKARRGSSSAEASEDTVGDPALHRKGEPAAGAAGRRDPPKGGEEGRASPPEFALFSLHQPPKSRNFAGFIRHFCRKCGKGLGADRR